MAIRKIKRNGNGMFGNKIGPKILKIAGWVLAIAVLFYGGFYFGEFLLSDKKPAEKPQSNTSTNEGVSESESTSAQPTDPKTDGRHIVLFMDVETAMDGTARQTFYEKAKKENATAIAFYTKDETGRIYYKTTNEIASKAASVDANAFDLSVLATEIKKAGFSPVAMMFTFKDPMAASKNADMAIWYNNGIKNYLWLDNYAENGGKPWLNPYNTKARQYLLDLTTEILAAGVDQIIYYGTEFGASAGNTSATYGDVTEDHMTTMKQFVAACEEKAKEVSAKCYFAVDALDLLNGNGRLGGSFLDLGATHISPIFNLSEMKKNTKIGEEVVSSPGDDPAGTTAKFMAAYDKKASGIIYLPVFEDYASVAKTQASSLPETTDYLLMQLA